MKRHKALRKIVGWGFVLFLAILVGGGYFAFTYVTDNETMRMTISARAPRFLPTSQLDVARVQVKPFAGKIILQNLSIVQNEDGISKLVGITPWVQVSYDPWALLDGKFDIKEVVVAQPKLRLRRRKDGTWNFEGLLASPWPLPPGEYSPPVRIENGTVELVDEADGPETPPAAILRDVSVRVASGDLHGTPIHFEGTAKGDLYENLKISGTFDRATGRATLSGDLNGLVISKNLSDRLPAEARQVYRNLGLQAGEVARIPAKLFNSP